MEFCGTSNNLYNVDTPTYLSVCLSLLIFSTPAMRTSSHFPGPAPQWDCWCCKVTPLPTPTTYCSLQQWPEQTFYWNSFLFYATISKDCYFLFWPTRWRQTTLHCSGWLICASVFFWFWSFSNFLVRPGGIALTQAPSLVVPWCNIGAGTNYRNHDPHNLGNNSLFNTLLVTLLMQ